MMAELMYQRKNFLYANKSVMNMLHVPPFSEEEAHPRQDLFALSSGNALQFSLLAETSLD